ncbi:unnamed protein product [Aphanomyces euteiches]
MWSRRRGFSLRFHALLNRSLERSIDVSQHGVDLTVVTEAVILAITKAASYNEVLDHLVVAVGDVDAQAILVSMKWILVHAAKYDIREADLLTEVQQLGLPSEMARTIASIYHTHQQELRRHLRRADTLANAATPCKWQVSYNLASRSSPVRIYLIPVD